MSRRAHDIKLVHRAKALRAQGFSYWKISRALFIEFGADVSESSVRDWVTYRTRAA